jgi:5-methylcytosine-specific restriction protein A
LQSHFVGARLNVAFRKEDQPKVALVKLGRQIVSLADLTRQSVEAALAEAASLGRDGFLKRYGFGPARQYFVAWKGAQYDSKAIAGAAHGYLPGRAPLTPADFSGGENTVARRLRELGFDVPREGERNPSWTRDELGPVLS